MGPTNLTENTANRIWMEKKKLVQIPNEKSFEMAQQIIYISRTTVQM
jgi:hypothetical protein